MKKKTIVKLFSFAFVVFVTDVAQAKVLLKPLSEYSQLSNEDKLGYSNQLRAAWLEFEKNFAPAGDKKVASGQWSVGLFSQAQAGWQGAPCFICGVTLSSISNGAGGSVCPVQARGCSSASGPGFQCGALFNGTCIENMPFYAITTRSFLTNNSLPIPVPSYNKAIGEVTGAISTGCSNPTNPGCARVQQSVAQANEQFTVPVAQPVVAPSPPAQQQHTQGASSAAVASTGDCRGTVDRMTGRPLVVTKFSFAVDQRCHFEQNKNLLQQLTTENCKSLSKETSDKIITTSIKIKNKSVVAQGKSEYGFLMDETSLIEGIIEGITDVGAPEGKAYKVQMLLPNLRQDGASLSRLYITILEKSGKYYLQKSDGSLSEEIEINNTARKNMLFGEFSATEQSRSRVIAGKIQLAQNCQLASSLPALQLSAPSAPATQ